MVKSAVHLSDSDYIYWAKKNEWSLTQAVYLLYGFLPPESDFPDQEELLEHQRQQKSKERTHRPEEWVILAISDGHIVNDCWKLIYPQWIPDKIGITLGKELNYPRFIEVLGTNTDIPLGQLVSFTLDLCDKEMVKPPKEFDYLLQDMKKMLGIKANNSEELNKWLVSPRQFMEKCSETKFVINEKCLYWYKLLNSNPDIADWLEVPSNEKEERPVQTNEAGVNQAPESKNMKGDPLTKKLEKVYETHSGETLDIDGYWDYVTHDSAFSDEHGSITYMMFSGKWNEVNRKAFCARIDRLKKRKKQQ